MTQTKKCEGLICGVFENLIDHLIGDGPLLFERLHVDGAIAPALQILTNSVQLSTSLRLVLKNIVPNPRFNNSDEVRCAIDVSGKWVFKETEFTNVSTCACKIAIPGTFSLHSLTSESILETFFASDCFI